MNKAMKILIVDDVSSKRRIIRNLRRELGFANTCEAAGAQTALSLLQNGGFDLVVTDWNTSGRQGIDLLAAVRADSTLCALPVLTVTAESRREQIIQAAQAGANGCIVKPFTAQTLAEKINRIFERAA